MRCLNRGNHKAGIERLKATVKVAQPAILARG